MRVTTSGSGPAGEAAAELNAAEAHYAAQTQQPSSSSSGGGGWNGVGQRFKNWFNGDGFKTNQQLNHEVGYSTVKILNYSEIDLSGLGFSAVNDQAGLTAALLGSGTLGAASTIVSVVHDPSFVNLDLTGLSNMVPLVIPGSEVPIAFGFAAYSGSQFAGNTLTTVFTPDALQSNTINANGITVQDPQAAFDAGNW